MAAFLIKDSLLDHHDQQPEAVTSFDMANSKEFPLVTLCWDENHFLNYMAANCDNPTILWSAAQKYELNFHKILQSCLAANMSIEALLNLDGYSVRMDVATGWELGS